MSIASNAGKGVLRTGTILDKIVDRKIEEVATLTQDEWATVYGMYRTEPLRDFVGALRRETITLIAEIKHASPSRGALIDDFDPVAISSTYALNGAGAISVLTDQDFFQGSLSDLKAVRDSVKLPVLRKDFIISEAQIAEAESANADAVLLIVAILDDARLRALFGEARETGIATLIEVHTEEEMERALKLSPPLIGINNRDLHTFKVDLEVTRRLATLVPPDVTLVAESGIHTASDVEAMAAVGARAVLVGESLITAADRAAKVRELSGVKRKP
jgi:indole-3-glycerol phosphate synthase